MRNDSPKKNSETPTEIASICELIANEVARLDYSITPAETATLARFLYEVLRWRKRTNLTGHKTAGELVKKRLADGMVLAQELSREENRQPLCLDVGAGAGFPGILVSILCPRHEITLVEPKPERAIFLQQIAHELKLNIKTENKQISELQHKQFFHVWSLATWSPDEWLDYAAPWVHDEGSVYLFGSDTSRAKEQSGTLKRMRTIAYSVVDGPNRVLDIYKKIEKK